MSIILLFACAYYTVYNHVNISHAINDNNNNHNHAWHGIL